MNAILSCGQRMGKGNLERGENSHRKLVGVT